jgi:transcriptional regulator with XRE-family HTH domain
LEAQEQLAARHIALRERARLTQEQEAKMAGVSPTTISGIESGKITRPHLKTLLKLAGALGVDVGELRESGKVEAPPSPEQPPLNGFEEERRASSVFARALITAAEQLINAEPPESLAGVLKRFGILEVLYNISEPLDELVNDSAHWERLSLDEQLEVSRAAVRLHDAARQLHEQNTEYLERRHEDRQAAQEARAMHEQMREWNRRRSA